MSNFKIRGIHAQLTTHHSPQLRQLTINMNW